MSGHLPHPILLLRIAFLCACALLMRATSPLMQAARIGQPVLLAYGAVDRRVPLYHGKKFVEALKEHNPNVEWVVYQEEAHGWSLPKNRIDFRSRVEKFLQRHIGTARGGDER